MRYGIALALLVALAACEKTGDDRGFFAKLKTAQGPDEYRIVPQKPLQEPQDLANLPTPIPGAPNRADLNARVDAAVALTGAAPSDPGAAAGDAALVAAVQARAAGTVVSGLDFGGLFGGGSDLLNADAELARLRALGIRTPAAPPG